MIKVYVINNFLYIFWTHVFKQKIWVLAILQVYMCTIYKNRRSLFRREPLQTWMERTNARYYWYDAKLISGFVIFQGMALTVLPEGTNSSSWHGFYFLVFAFFFKFTFFFLLIVYFILSLHTPLIHTLKCIGHASKYFVNILPILNHL